MPDTKNEKLSEKSSSAKLCFSKTRERTDTRVEFLKSSNAAKKDFSNNLLKKQGAVYFYLLDSPSFHIFQKIVQKIFIREVPVFKNK